MKKREQLSAYFIKKQASKKTETEHLSLEDVNTEYYEDETINIEPVLHDTITLSTPMKPLCSPDCKGLCPTCGIDLNIEACTCEVKKNDPRWDPLKKLLEKK
jgi:uncharacterized protein